MASKRRFTGGGVIALAVVAFLFLGGLTGFGPSLPNPFASDTVDTPHPALLTELRDLREYHAASASFQQLVDLEDDARYLPDFLRGEHVTLLAAGSVDGVVDFSSLAAGAIDVDGSSATITLPRARLGVVAIDHEETEIIDRDRGLFDRIGDVFVENPGSDAEVLVLAEDKIEAAALESGLLRRAEANTREMLDVLLTELGFDDVTVVFVRSAAVASR